MKEKEWDYDDNDDEVNITAVKFFGMPNGEFLGKETENKNKKEEDKRKGNRNDGS